MSALSTAIAVAGLVLLPLGCAWYAASARKAVVRARAAGDHQSMVTVRRMLIMRMIWMTGAAAVFAALVSALIVLSD